jgi:hypothetical protein
MPLRRTKVIDHLQINVRTFACHRNPQEESYGPRAKRLCAVLDGLVRCIVFRGVSGPVLGGRIKDTVVRANQGKIRFDGGHWKTYYTQLYCIQRINVDTPHGVPQDPHELLKRSTAPRERRTLHNYCAENDLAPTESPATERLSTMIDEKGLYGFLILHTFIQWWRTCWNAYTHALWNTSDQSRRVWSDPIGEATICNGHRKEISDEIDAVISRLASK